jgi:hypothetical protein
MFEQWRAAVGWARPTFWTVTASLTRHRQPVRTLSVTIPLGKATSRTYSMEASHLAAVALVWYFWHVAPYVMWFEKKSGELLAPRSARCCVVVVPVIS